MDEFNGVYMSGLDEIPLKGFVSASKNRETPLVFLEKTASSISGAKVKIIFKIHSVKGVFLDDLSDYGANLVADRHPGWVAQDEVLLEEGYFKMIGKPTPIKNADGGLLKDADGTLYYDVELQELSKPLNR